MKMNRTREQARSKVREDGGGRRGKSVALADGPRSQSRIEVPYPNGSAVTRARAICTVPVRTSSYFNSTEYRYRSSTDTGTGLPYGSKTTGSLNHVFRTLLD
jgi:hypothetical protein